MHYVGRDGLYVKRGGDDCAACAAVYAGLGKKDRRIREAVNTGFMAAESSVYSVVGGRQQLRFIDYRHTTAVAPARSVCSVIPAYMARWSADGAHRPSNRRRRNNGELY